MIASCAGLKNMSICRHLSKDVRRCPRPAGGSPDRGWVRRAECPPRRVYRASGTSWNIFSTFSAWSVFLLSWMLGPGNGLSAVSARIAAQVAQCSVRSVRERRVRPARRAPSRCVQMPTGHRARAASHQEQCRARERQSNTDVRSPLALRARDSWSFRPLLLHGASSDWARVLRPGTDARHEFARGAWRGH